MWILESGLFGQNCNSESKKGNDTRIPKNAFDKSFLTDTNKKEETPTLNVKKVSKQNKTQNKATTEEMKKNTASTPKNEEIPTTLSLS